MQGYIEQNIPLDTQWVDIDYMQDYKDFTFND
jgi:alpha-glucosidase (family GH31 glycosyl hydrolase)